MDMNLSKQWRTEEPDVLQSMGSRRIKHDLATEQQWQDDVGDGMEEILLFQNNKRIEPGKAIQLLWILYSACNRNHCIFMN